MQGAAPGPARCEPAAAEASTLKHAEVLSPGSPALAAGRKAVQVAPQPHHGLVAVLQETFGLVEYSPNQPYVKEVREGKQRIRFNPTDVSCWGSAHSPEGVAERWPACYQPTCAPGLGTPAGSLCADFRAVPAGQRTWSGKGVSCAGGSPCAAVIVCAVTSVPGASPACSCNGVPASAALMHFQLQTADSLLHPASAAAKQPDPLHIVNFCWSSCSHLTVCWPAQGLYPC